MSWRFSMRVLPPCADLRTFSWSYHQRGLVATVRTDAPNSTAWQRFLPTGPLALLPVRGGFSNVVWSTSAAQASALERAGAEAFAGAVNEVGHVMAPFPVRGTCCAAGHRAV
jgi:2-polyprenyl-6-methoxyphenol hydroxylase-like FAD-dependent oxidoreductase